MERKRYSFGEYEFDAELLELYRYGETQPLKHQSAKALLFLLRLSGRLASRDALADFIWKGRAVDAENGINACIRDIRKALCDSATNPAFIETLPKRGYRFIGAIETSQSDGENPIIDITARALKSAQGIGASRLVLAAIGVLALLISGAATRWPPSARLVPAEPREKAVHAYLEGARALAENSQESITLASARFREAVKIDPTFVRAQSGLALSLFLISDRKNFDEVKSAINVALAAEPENAELHLLKGRIMWSFRHDWAAAEKSFRRALTIDPMSLNARMALAKAHILMGDEQRAQKMVREARAIRPEILSKRGDAGWIMYLAGENDASKDHCAESALMEPGGVHAPRCYLDVYLTEKDFPRAARAALDYMRAMGATDAEIARATDEDPKTILERFSSWEIENLSGGTLRSSPKRIMQAISLTYLGRQDEALQLIRESRENGDFFFPFVAIIPAFEPLHEIEEFTEIVAALNLNNNELAGSSS